MFVDGVKTVLFFPSTFYRYQEKVFWGLRVVLKLFLPNRKQH